MGSSQSSSRSRNRCHCEDRALKSPHFLRLAAPEVCPLTTSIRIALQFKGLHPDFAFEQSGDLDLSSLDERGGMNPRWRLEHGDDVVAESAHQILFYVEKKFRSPSLVPSWWMKKKVRSWVSYILRVLTPSISRVLREGNPFDAMEQQDRVLLSRALDSLEEGISREGPYFMGDRFTMVDVYLIPVLELLNCLSFTHGFQVKDTHLKLRSYMKRMAGFAAYAPVAVDSARLIATSFPRLLEDRILQAPVIAYTVLQHRSLARHLEKLASAMAEAKSQPVVKRWRKETATTKELMNHTTMVRQIGRDYDRLLVLLQQHAQMEEQFVFAALEKAKRGVTKAVIEEHARDLPVMNGVREDIKSVVTLEPGTSSYTEALNALSNKVKLLETHTKEHFREEETEILPLLEAAGLEAKEQEMLVVSCVSVMDSSHLHLLPFYLSGLLPHEIHGYMILLHRSVTQSLMSSVVQVLKSDEEFQWVWEVVQRSRQRES